MPCWCMLNTEHTLEFDTNRSQWLFIDDISYTLVRVGDFVDDFVEA